MSTVLSLDTFDPGSYVRSAVEKQLLKRDPDPFPKRIMKLKEAVLESIFNQAVPKAYRVRALIHYGSVFAPGRLVRERVDEHLWDVRFREARRIDLIDESLHNTYPLVRPALNQLSVDCLDPVYKDYLIDYFRRDNPVYRVCVASAIPVLWAECTKEETRNCLPLDEIFCNGMQPPLFDEPLTGCVTPDQLIRYLENYVDQNAPINDLGPYPTLADHLEGILRAVDEDGNPLPDIQKIQLITLYTTQDCASIDIDDIDWAIESTKLLWSGDAAYLGDPDWGEEGTQIIE